MAKAINGVLPTIITQAASYEVAEVLRYLSGKAFQKLITIDTWHIDYKAMNVDILKDHACEVCTNQNYSP